MELEHKYLRNNDTAVQLFDFIAVWQRNKEPKESYDLVIKKITKILNRIYGEGYSQGMLQYNTSKHKWTL